jgi:uncharacterized membrane protein YphA (DoxX/SURF4 family)
MKAAIIICRLILAAIFLLASVPKIIAPHEFAVAVFRYQLLPDAAINLMAIFLPWIELVAAIAILIPRTSAAAAAIFFGLLTVFTVAISIDLVRGIDISCGCFTLDTDAGPIGWWEVVRDIGFLAVAGFVLWAGLRPAKSSIPMADEWCPR